MAVKATTCKEAIARWEKKTGENAAEAKVIELQFQWPPIEKMDGALSTLVACELRDLRHHLTEERMICQGTYHLLLESERYYHVLSECIILLGYIFIQSGIADKLRKLSLSSNMIDKIVGIAGMRSLKILSLGRNYIKSLAGIETVAETLEELWISYNPIDKLKGIGVMKVLRVLYMSNNAVKEWAEFNRLQECPSLRDIVFNGNPICENQPDVDTWRTQASNRLQQITKLDGIPIIRESE